MKTTTDALTRAVEASVRCTKCGAQGVGSCQCWEPCPCGWVKERGGRCGNGVHDKPRKVPRRKP